jgi:hypothetical protein
VTPGPHRPPPGLRRGEVTRTLVAGVFLLLELPLLLPLIAGAGAIWIVIQVST